MQVKVNVIAGRLGAVEVEMSGATTIHYAAKRAAEAFGLDGEAYWGLLRNGAEVLPNLDLISEHCHQPLMLAILLEE